MRSKTLSQIIDACHEDGRLSDRELKCAVIALEALGVMDSRDLRRVCLVPMAEGKARQFDRKSTVEESHRRGRLALKAVPERWIGDRTPGDPEHLKRRRTARRLYARALRGELPRSEIESK